MTDQLDEDVVQRVDDLGSTLWSGTAYRYTTRGRDPVSGIGARLFGARWNPRGVFTTIYLAQPLSTCLAEFDRTALAAGLDSLDKLTIPHELHTLTARRLAVLDLQGEEAMGHLELTLNDIADEDWSACQAVGHAAWFLGMSGLVAPSATGSGIVIAAFPSRLQPGQLDLADTVKLDEATYRRAREGC